MPGLMNNNVKELTFDVHIRDICIPNPSKRPLCCELFKMSVCCVASLEITKLLQSIRITATALLTQRKHLT